MDRSWEPWQHWAAVRKHTGLLPGGTFPPLPWTVQVARACVWECGCQPPALEAAESACGTPGPAGVDLSRAVSQRSECWTPLICTGVGTSAGRLTRAQEAVQGCLAQ